jgi:hypothetical protein
MRHETTLADPPGARTAVKTGARLHRPRIGLIASVSIIGLACKPWSGFQLGEIEGVRFPAKAWSKASAATLRKARLEMTGVPAGPRKTQAQLSRRPVDFKHKGGVQLAAPPGCHSPDRLKFRQ